MEKRPIAEINQYTGSSVNPLNTPEQIYELYSVPSFESGYPEIIKGADIGSTKITVEEGDVLICKINPRINRVWIVRHHTAYPLIASSEWIVVRNKEINSEYLKWYFSSEQFRSKINSQVAGIGGSLTRAQPKQVSTYIVPIPTYSQQETIAQQLEIVALLIQKRKQQLEKLDELVKARFIELFGDTKSNERKWKTLPLHKVLESGSSVSYGIVQTGDDIEGGVPVFRPIDIAGGKIPRREQLKRTAIDISNQYSRTLLKGYELLITVRGSVGETFRITSEFAGCNVGRNIVPLRFDTTIVDYSFMQHFFAQEGTKQVLESMTKGIALQGLNMSEFREIDVIIPDMSLQQQFATFVEQTDKSKLAIQKSLEQLEMLKKALMQKHFS